MQVRKSSISFLSQMVSTSISLNALSIAMQSVVSFPDMMAKRTILRCFVKKFKYIKQVPIAYFCSLVVFQLICQGSRMQIFFYRSIFLSQLQIEVVCCQHFKILISTLCFNSANFNLIFKQWSMTRQLMLLFFIFLTFSFSFPYSSSSHCISSAYLRTCSVLTPLLFRMEMPEQC